MTIDIPPEHRKTLSSGPLHPGAVLKSGLEYYFFTDWITPARHPVRKHRSELTLIKGVRGIEKRKNQKIPP